ncbi:hypothetical protein [Methylomonas methanica]|uniref:hypothetical protein n=1 Tax=Methylomonas methanica TaxID=421 RepID=UPI0011D1CD87|nr:hypothetical protein [Methylomonas methanica]
MHDLDEAKSRAPSGYSEFVTEPAFSMDKASCIWYLEGADWVKYGGPVRGLAGLEVVANWMPNDYQAWATEYYEREIDLSLVERVFDGEFSEEIAKNLNPEVELSELLSELPEIGIGS